MPRWTPGNFVISDASPEHLHKALNPDKGGRPEGAMDKSKTGKRNRPRQTHKAAVIKKAAEWHVATAETNVEVTVERFFEEYAQGMTVSRRYFKSQLASEISKLSQ